MASFQMALSQNYSMKDVTQVETGAYQRGRGKINSEIQTFWETLIKINQSKVVLYFKFCLSFKEQRMACILATFILTTRLKENDCL